MNKDEIFNEILKLVKGVYKKNKKEYTYKEMVEYLREMKELIKEMEEE